MAGGLLKIDVRRGKILEQLRQEGAVSVSQLAQALGTTPVTIRSDLAALEKDGCLLRIQGGALRKGPAPEDMAAPPETRAIRSYAAKRAIANAVAQKIHDGDTLFINSGTTMELVSAALGSHRNLHIVTNAMKVAMELVRFPSFHVILLGGEINAQYSFIYGSDAQSQLRHYQADWALLTLDGISAEGGLTTYHAEEASINCMMSAQAQQILIAADHTKVGRMGFFRFAGAEGVQLITDAAADRRAVDDLEAAGIRVQIAD